MTSHHSSLWTTFEQELVAIASALVGGFKYGVKIRLPHALVMTALFKRDLSHSEKLRSILRLAYEHASNLAKFATLYKVSESTPNCVFPGAWEE